VPLDLRADARHRVERLVRLTPALSGVERLHLAAVVETQVESLRRAGVGWAATCAVRVDGPPPRLSTALITLACGRSTAAAASSSDAVARHLAAAGGARRTGPVDLPLGRALAIVEETPVRTHVSAVGRRRERVHRVRHAHLVVAHPDRRHLVTLSVGTSAGRTPSATGTCSTPSGGRCRSTRPPVGPPHALAPAGAPLTSRSRTRRPAPRGSRTRAGRAARVHRVARSGERAGTGSPGHARRPRPAAGSYRPRS
jgi:hypothetical protein